MSTGRYTATDLTRHRHVPRLTGSRDTGHRVPVPFGGATRVHLAYAWVRSNSKTGITRVVLRW